MKHDDLFIRKEYIRNLLAVMLTVLGGTINALIDSVFVSNRLGADGLAAVNLSMPVYLVLCTLGVLFSKGASIHSAKAAGEENADLAREYFLSGIALDLISGLAIMAVGIPASGPIARFLAHHGPLTEFVRQYILVILIGTIPFLIIYIFSYYLQLDGKFRSISVMMLIMVATDFLLDWIFLYPLRMGMTGAALASVISTAAACGYGFYMMERGKTAYRFTLRELRPKHAAEIARFGSPGAMGNFVDTIRLFFLNSIILSAGGERAAAVWAIINTVAELSMLITSGVPLAGGPMCGVYNASRENSGIRLLIRLEQRIGLALGTLYAVLIVSLNNLWELVFATDENLLFPMLCLGIYVILDVFINIFIVFFNSTGRIGVSITWVLLRKLLMPVGVAWLLLITGGYLWLFMPVGALLALLAGVLITRQVARRSAKDANPLSPWLLLDDRLSRENKVIDFSIPANMDEVCEAVQRLQDFCAVNEMDRKQTNRLGLAIEELIGVLIRRNPGIETLDLRAYALPGMTGVRIRCAGKNYNPFDEELIEEDEELMGIMMLKRMAELVHHSYTLGMNTINITFDR